MDAIREIVADYEEFGIKSVSVFPAGTFPQVPINDKRMYPIYAKCVELGLSVWVNAGIPGPRLKGLCQHVELIDEVMYDFPELTFVTMHGCEPWEELAVKLMLKWPGLHYCTSAFAPKYYPKAVIDYANTRGADKVIYAGYYPMGLSLERIMTEMPAVPFRDHVWPKFLYENAARVLGLRRGVTIPTEQLSETAACLPGRRTNVSRRRPAARSPARGRRSRWSRRTVLGATHAGVRPPAPQRRQILEPRPDRFGDQPFLVFPERTFTYRSIEPGRAR